MSAGNKAEATTSADEPKRSYSLPEGQEPRVPVTTLQPPLELTRTPLAPPKAQGTSQQRPPRELATTARPPKPELSVLDHPILGGKLTVCVLCYGPYTDIARRCVDSILTTVPRSRMDLRIATNEAAPQTVEYLRGVNPDQLYVNPDNRKKYPVMREMFHDPEAPITTKYLVWFDDDAFAVDPKWLTRLAETIVANHPQNCRLFGKKMYHDLRTYMLQGHDPFPWFRQASWWRGKNLAVRGSLTREAPNGTVIPFAAGWFWACSTDVIKSAGIPDVRLQHNGGDILISEQVHQYGWKVKDFNSNKQFVSTPSKEQGGRRGIEQSFPWCNPTAQFERYYRPGV